ncbi:hypothetical protein BRADI_3g08913v3 [Brachypodium distachyon]|uniref:Uncharacterized protein n=1 Tax=Brachypodium distachyon TaxID=15368 RepID=A0A0Q3F3X8_BRADI|nr:hypothetical protein BRADI_3g08913v3 [Brachypodium distachyon]
MHDKDVKWGISYGGTARQPESGTTDLVSNQPGLYHRNIRLEKVLVKTTDVSQRQLVRYPVAERDGKPRGG